MSVAIRKGNAPAPARCEKLKRETTMTTKRQELETTTRRRRIKSFCNEENSSFLYKFLCIEVKNLEGKHEISQYFCLQCIAVIFGGKKNVGFSTFVCSYYDGTRLKD